MVLTGTLFLCPQGRAETLDRLFQVVLVLLHILNGLVALGEEALKSANLGEKPAADLLMRAVEQVCAAGILTPDLGGKATTAEVTRAVCEAVRGMNR